MPDARDRLDEQFSPGGERAEIWRAFDLFLDTDRYLNLGYSPRGVPTLLGSSQRRLALEVGRRTTTALENPRAARVLDLGCGRGGPTVDLVDGYGFHVTGVDFIPWNAARAREHAAATGVDASFVVGDATALPFCDASFDACTVIDAGVYFPSRARAFSSVHDTLVSGGALVTTDLLAKPELPDAVAKQFTDAWGFASLPTREEYVHALTDAGFIDVTIEDLSRHSIARFPKYTRLFRAIDATPMFAAVRLFLARHDIDVDAVTEQIHAADAALPALEHVVVTASAAD